MNEEQKPVIAMDSDRYIQLLKHDEAFEIIKAKKVNVHLFITTCNDFETLSPHAILDVYNHYAEYGTDLTMKEFKKLREVLV